MMEERGGNVDVDFVRLATLTIIDYYHLLSAIYIMLPGIIKENRKTGMENLLVLLWCSVV